MVFQNRYFYCFLVVFCVAMLVRQSNARPPWRPGSGVFSQSAECHKDDELLDLCQRCAKLSRQYKNALSDCCSTTDMQARRFCSDFVYFGRGEVDFIGD